MDATLWTTMWGGDLEPTDTELESADGYARRTYFAYTPEQISAGEMVGGSPVFNRNIGEAS